MSEDSEVPPSALLTAAPDAPAPVIATPAPMQAGSSLVHLLSDRIKMYEEAIENANAVGEMSRARRFVPYLKCIMLMCSVAVGLLLSVIKFIRNVE